MNVHVTRCALLACALALVACEPGQKKPGPKSSTAKPDTTMAPEVTAPTVTPKAAPKVEPLKLDPKGLRFVTMAMVSDATTWFQRGNTLKNWGDLAGISVVASAPEVAKLYKENVIAADERYKGKGVLLWGAVTSVQKDLSDKIYVALKGDKMFQTVHAYLVDSALAKAGKVNKGDEIDLVCKGAKSSVMSTPVFKDCEFAEETGKRVAALVPEKLAGWINGTDSWNWTESQFGVFFLFYTMGKELPDDHVCWKAMTKPCEDALTAHGKKLEKPTEAQKVANKKLGAELMAVMKFRPDPPEPKKP